jgi:hypothetical protein
VRKISPQPGFDPRIVLPVAIRYTDYAIPAVGVWKIKYQLPDCFKRSCPGMWTHVIVEQKNRKTCALVANRRLQMFLTPSDHKKKRITARCSTTAQFESGASIFKEGCKQTQH